MEIGEKLKTKRMEANLTQEQVAEALSVSRQTISNWENEKSYPDIINVIQLSDLYSVSLDELLKGDQKMIAHLKENTNTVKSNQKLLAAILANIVLFLLLLFMAGFMPDNAYMMACIFCLAVIGTASLLYQIIKKI